MLVLLYCCWSFSKTWLFLCCCLLVASDGLYYMWELKEKMPCMGIKPHTMVVDHVPTDKYSINIWEIRVGTRAWTHPLAINHGPRCSVMMNNWWHKDIRHLAKDEWVLDINSIFYRSLPTGKRIDKICWFNRMYFGTEYNIKIIA